MALKFCCECGQKLKTGDDLVKKRAKCPKCGKWLRVPQSDSYDTVAKPAEARKRKKSKKASAETPPESQPDSSKARIVIADSMEEDLQNLETLLRQHGYEVITANDGPEAVELIRSERPDAIILDVKLDILSGFQVVEHIRNPTNPKNDAVWTTPVLMTTERSRGRDKQYAMSLGVKGFFGKPIAPAQLCFRLEKEISRQPGHE